MFHLAEIVEQGASLCGGHIGELDAVHAAEPQRLGMDHPSGEVIMPECTAGAGPGPDHACASIARSVREHQNDALRNCKQRLCQWDSG